MTTPNNPDRKASVRRCKNCGFDNEPGRALCQNCGLSLTAPTPVADENMTTLTPVLPLLPKPADTLALSKRTCPKCGEENPATAFRCQKCGESLDSTDLFSKPPALPASMGGTSVLGDVRPALPAVKPREQRSGSAPRLASGAPIRLVIAGAANTITVRPQAENIIGRRDPMSNSAPDVDLTAFAAYRQGISRRHAALRVKDGVVELLDLGSSNGTYVNGQRLEPYQPYALRSGDEISLARMILRIHFLTAG